MDQFLQRIEGGVDVRSADPIRGQSGMLLLLFLIGKIEV